MQQEIDEFLSNYFELIIKVNKFHCDYLKSNHFIFPKNDYIELKKFIDTAVNFLRERDSKILENIAGKLYNDLNSLYKFYNDFKKKSQYTKNVYYQEFLENISKYKELKKELTKLKSELEEYNSIISTNEEKLKTMSENDSDYKKVKKIYVDAVYEASKKRERLKEVKELIFEMEKASESEFFIKFENLRNDNLEKIKNIINVKLYYFEKVLWYNASKSDEIIKFFEEANIDGDFSTKTFIRYFLRNIDMSKSHNSEWLAYLQRSLKVIE